MRPDRHRAPAELLAVVRADQLFEAQRMGLRVRKDIAIAGFDDADVAQSVVPSLTTVKMPEMRLACAAELLLERMQDGRGGRRVYDLDFEIVARESA